MIKTSKLSDHLNIKVKRFTLKVVTPVVLLAGLLALAFFNFRGVLATTTQQDNLFKGEAAYSTGPLQFTFQELAGTDRPALSYDGLSFLTYVDWSSTISIDGHVQNLWDNYHGYDFDRTNPDNKQFFSTTSSADWQVIEVVSLLNAHTVTVHYDFVAHAQDGAFPHSVTLSIEHVHHTLYEPAISGNTLVADVLPGFLQNTNSGSTPHAVGTLTFQVSGPALAQTGAISLDAVRGNAGPDGVVRSLADSFTTTYTLQNPEVNRMMPLGTETIVFTPSVSAGTPIAAPVATPTAIGI